MLAFLNHPFPCNYATKEKLVAAFLIGLFVSGFLIIFQPFGLRIANNALDILSIAGYGLITTLVLLFIYFGLPSIVPSFFQEKNYTVGKELIISTLMILLIGFANSLYSQILFDTSYGHSLFGMIWQTFLIGIFPLTFLTFLQFNHLKRANTKVSQEISLPQNKTDGKAISIEIPLYYHIPTDQKKAPVILKNLLFLESDGNYVYLHEILDDNHYRSTHRITLKSLEAENTFPNVIRCHRSFIVNLDKVINVSGNAQGLKLEIENCSEIVPVSRKYISAVKSYFEASK